MTHHARDLRQFERSTWLRAIRDKVAASGKKGIGWVDGTAGYEVRATAVISTQADAERVRSHLQRFVQRKSAKLWSGNWSWLAPKPDNGHPVSPLDKRCAVPALLNKTGTTGLQHWRSRGTRRSSPSQTITRLRTKPLSTASSGTGHAILKESPRKPAPAANATGATHPPSRHWSQHRVLSVGTYGAASPHDPIPAKVAAYRYYIAKAH